MVTQQTQITVRYLSCEKSHVKSLTSDNNTIVHDRVFVMKQLKTFYNSLYSRRSVKTERECFDYLPYINTPAISEDDQTLCDGHIKMNEIFGAFKGGGGGGGVRSILGYHDSFF